MITSIQAARAVCEFGQWDVSNLVLQKILYIAHGTYMAQQGADKPLITGTFYAWHYGPVVPDLYRKFRMFGPDEIREYALTMKYKTKAPEEIKGKGEEEIQHIEKAMGWLEGLRPARLIAITHADGGAWKKNYSTDSANIIPNKDIFTEYTRYFK